MVPMRVGGGEGRVLIREIGGKRDSSYERAWRYKNIFHVGDGRGTER